MMDIERLVREAIDGPAPPDPPEPDERPDDDGPRHVHVVAPLVIVWPDGGVGADDWRGSLLLAMSCLALAWAAWCVAGWLWAGLVAFLRWLYVGTDVQVLVLALGAALGGHAMTRTGLWLWRRGRGQTS